MSKLIRLAFSAALLGFIAWRTDWGEVVRAFANLRVELWLAGVGLLLVSQAVSARRWQLFAFELRFERTVPQLLSYYLIGMYFNLLLPTSVGGDVIRAWYLNAGAGRRLAAFASVFLERFSGLLVLIAVACLAVLLSPRTLPWWIPCAVWAIGGGAVCGLAATPLLTRWRLVPARRREQLRDLLDALHSPRTLARATLLSIFVQCANVVVVWMIGVGLDAPVPVGYYFVFVPMVSLLTLLPVSVNGMGVREGGVALFLAHLPGVPEGTAVTLAFLWFASGAAVSLVGGAVYLFGAFPKPDAERLNEGKEDDGPVDRGADQGREGQLDQAA